MPLQKTETIRFPLDARQVVALERMLQALYAELAAQDARIKALEEAVAKLKEALP